MKEIRKGSARSRIDTISTDIIEVDEFDDFLIKWG